MIKTEIKGLKEVENFLLALADNLASVVREEIAAGPTPVGKLPKQRDNVALRRSRGVSATLPPGLGPAAVGRPKRAVRRNFQVPGLDPGKRGGA